MKQIFSALLIFMWPYLAAAAMDVPQITFAQATNMVIAAKHANPSLLDMRLSQQQALVQINLIVANSLNRLQAKAMGLSVLHLAKSMSLDTPPAANNKANDLGQGLYDYTLLIAKPNGQPWLQASKAATTGLVQWQDVSPTVPATRALIQQLQQQQASGVAKPAPLPPQPVSPLNYEAGAAPVFGAP
jgi:hypothetical protein